MADMSDMLKNFSSMMEGKEIPDNIKQMLNSLQNSTLDTKNSSNTSSQHSGKEVNQNSSNSSSNFNNKGDTSQSIPNIDIDTMLKFQKIINAMNSSSNSSGVNLLRSLKPYLKPSRQVKVDEYIQLFNLEKVIELMKQSGGEKNDS